MSVAAKTRLIKIEITEGKRHRLYLVPKGAAHAVATLLDGFDEADEEGSIDARELYPELNDPAKRAAIAFHGTRLRLGLTQQQMAKKLGLSQSDVSKIEKGEREISRKLAMRIGKTFAIDYKRFL
jgi:DNA-binding XRE family transcriptional regulator